MTRLLFNEGLSQDMTRYDNFGMPAMSPSLMDPMSQSPPMPGSVQYQQDHKGLSLSHTDEHLIMPNSATFPINDKED